MTIYRGVRVAATAASLLLLTTACAQTGGADAAEDAAAGGSALSGDALVLRVDYTGGFTTPAMLATRLPMISVYADGRVITQGPTILVYPGPAMPNLQVQTISAEQVDDLVKQALAAGVGTVSDLGTPPVADAASTRFTVQTADGVEQLEVYALAEAADAGQSGLTDEQVSAREKLRAFADSLTDLPGTIGGSAEDSAPYVAEAIAAVAEPWVAVDESVDASQPEVAWPGPQLPGTALSPNLELGCVTVTGAELEKLRTLAEDATTATPWTSDGKRWTVTLRPLLPDESDCADIAASR
ncbi:hypothetical protein O7623_12850 [Solwaraspora sp. WMMD791]|uniref:hypothetical protein n=1 Tax=Solwaraspora sp. WMMD791 TaxID=3016086 RepID=UPI00249ACD44|nr:hypothetical protein [Solwaraspora sp. WMMD791]WFE30016.1 hypothetical protein O7623_12850 [Solwaraspora sp. WMMD791]